MYEREVEKLQEIIDKSADIVFFGGAGVSTESGIPDFRGASGIFHQKYEYVPEQVVSHSFFMQNTKQFYKFYKEKMMFLDAKPNAAHLMLARLEQAGKLCVVLYEEGLDPDTMAGAVRAIAGADTLIIGGTSLAVYPAAGFIDYFRGKNLVVINKSDTTKTVGADLTISAPIGEILGSIHV